MIINLGLADSGLFTFCSFCSFLSFNQCIAAKKDIKHPFKNSLCILHVYPQLNKELKGTAVLVSDVSVQ